MPDIFKRLLFIIYQGLISDMIETRLEEVLYFLKKKKNFKYIISVLLSGIFTGFFVWSLLSYYHIILKNGSTLITSLILFALIYPFFWILSSTIINHHSKLDLQEVLRRDALTYLPSLLFIFYIVRFFFPPFKPVYIVDVAADAVNVLGKFLLLVVITTTISLKVLFFGFSERYEEKLETRLQNTSDKIVYSLIALFIITFSILAILGYRAYLMSWDLAIYDQALWNTVHGRFFEASVQQGAGSYGKIMHSRIILSQHFQPIFLLIIPFYVFYQSPITLLLIQIVVVSLGVLPIYWLSTDVLDSRIAGIVFSIAYLSYPAINYIVLLDFHPVALAMTFLLYTFYYLQKNDNTKFWIFLVLALMCKENISLVVIMLGVYISLGMKKKVMGAIVSVLGLAWFLFAMFVVTPYFSGVSFYYVVYYSYLGKDLTSIIQTLIFHPIFVLRNVVTFIKVGYLLLLFIPLGFTSILSPSHLLISLPIFAQNLLSGHPFQHSIYTQYNSPIIPFLFFSAIYGLKKTTTRKNVFHALLFFILLNSLFSNFFFSASPLNHFSPIPTSKAFRTEDYVMTANDLAAKKMMKMIPDDASVSADISLLAHLNHRQDLYFFATYYDKVDYVIFDVQQSPQIREELLENRDYSIVAEEGGFILFKRVS